MAWRRRKLGLVLSVLLLLTAARYAGRFSRSYDDTQPASTRNMNLHGFLSAARQVLMRPAAVGSTVTVVLGRARRRSGPPPVNLCATTDPRGLPCAAAGILSATGVTASLELPEALPSTNG